MTFSSTEYGAAFLEAAVATAILAALLIGIVDVSRRATWALRHSGETWRDVWTVPGPTPDRP